LLPRLNSNANSCEAGGPVTPKTGRAASERAPTLAPLRQFFSCERDRDCLILKSLPPMCKARGSLTLADSSLA
jgi:hypothetical protein